MGFESEVLKIWDSLTPIAKGRPRAVQTISQWPIFPVDKRDTKPRAYVIDMPAHMHYQGKATTFGAWLTQERKIIQDVFSDLGCTLIVLLFDCGTPANKTLSRTATVGETPMTPKEGWRAHLAEKARGFDDMRVNPLDENLTIHDTDLNLPGQRKPKDAPPGLFSHEDYLGNKDFKALFYEIICANLLETLTIDPNHVVILRGPGKALKLENGEITAPDENCKFRYKEADSVVGYFATLLKDFTVYVESIDGDVLLALLMGCNSRLLGGVPSLAPSCTGNSLFTNRVILLRNQRNPAWPNTIIDINLLYTSILTRAAWFKRQNALVEPITKEPIYKYVARNPILDNVVLGLLSGRNDYVLKSLLPQIGSTTLFKTYADSFGAYPRGLTYPHVIGTKYMGCYVDAVALIRFVICCYKARSSNLKIDLNNFPLSLKNIQENLGAKYRDEAPTLARMRMLAAHLSWYMTYFSNASYHEQTYPDPMKRENGASVWGWKMERTTQDEYGFVQAAWDEEVDIEWIDKLFEPGQQINLDTKVAKLKAPRADPTKLISDQGIF
jgi:hypothetical protein